MGHSARLMAGIRKIGEAIADGELGRVAFIEANFSNERALELTPKTWRWYKDKAPGGPLSQLAIHQFDVMQYLGRRSDFRQLHRVEIVAGGRRSRRSVDDFVEIRGRKNWVCGLVLDFAGSFCGARVRVQGIDAL